MRSTRDIIYQYLQLSNYQTIKLPATIKHIIPLIINLILVTLQELEKIYSQSIGNIFDIRK